MLSFFCSCLMGNRYKGWKRGAREGFQGQTVNFACSISTELGTNVQRGPANRHKEVQREKEFIRGQKEIQRGTDELRSTQGWVKGRIEAERVRDWLGVGQKSDTTVNPLHLPLVMPFSTNKAMTFLFLRKCIRPRHKAHA